MKNGLFYQLARGRNDRTAIALLLSLALASGTLAPRFELDANTIAYKDAKTLAVVFKAANERQIELKASDLAMGAFILSMTKVWCKALPAGDAVRN